MLRRILPVLLWLGVLAGISSCQSAPQVDEIQQKREENLKQMYEKEMALLRGENEYLRAQVTELTVQAKKLESDLRLAQSEIAELNKKPTSGTAPVVAITDKTPLRCRILAVNERLNVLMVSFTRGRAPVQNGIYDIYTTDQNHQLLGRITVKDASNDWASLTPPAEQNIKQFKLFGISEIELAPSVLNQSGE